MTWDPGFVLPRHPPHDSWTWTWENAIVLGLAACGTTQLVMIKINTSPIDLFDQHCVRRQIVSAGGLWGVQVGCAVAKTGIAGHGLDLGLSQSLSLGI